MALSIQISERAGVRHLHFGTHWIQGAMRIARPWALELDYTREMMMALLLRPDPHWPRNVLLIGLGAGSLTKFLYRHRPQARLTVIEIEPEVVETARHQFKLPDDPQRLVIEIGDGHDYVSASARRFDLILVDGFDAKGRSGMLDTLPFYSAGRARLSSDGLLVTNLVNHGRGVVASVDRMRKAFERRVLALPPCVGGNTVVVAAAGDAVEATSEELLRAARKLWHDTGLNLLPSVTRLVSALAGTGGRLTV